MTYLPLSSVPPPPLFSLSPFLPLSSPSFTFLLSFLPFYMHYSSLPLSLAPLPLPATFLFLLFLSFHCSPLPPLSSSSSLLLSLLLSFLPSTCVIPSFLSPLLLPPPFHFSLGFSLPHLQKELGDRLLPCFKSTSGIPFSDVNLLTGHAHAPEWGPDSSVSEVSTIQMEFRDLTQLTDDHKYQVMKPCYGKLEM